MYDKGWFTFEQVNWRWMTLYIPHPYCRKKTFRGFPACMFAEGLGEGQGGNQRTYSVGAFNRELMQAAYI